MRKMLNRRRWGFTLIEILCVVVIIGIASAIILPQISSRDDLRCASAARAIMADLLYAQNRSIALQQMHFVQFNAATNSYQVMDNTGASGGPGAIITHPVQGLPYTVTINNGALGNVSFSSTSTWFDGQTTIGFDSMGIPYSWNGTTTTPLNSGQVIVKCGNNTLTVTVAAYSGEIKVQ